MRIDRFPLPAGLLIAGALLTYAVARTDVTPPVASGPRYNANHELLAAGGLPHVGVRRR